MKKWAKSKNSIINTEVTGKNELGECFEDLLELVNKIRLVIQDEEIKQYWNVKVFCNLQEILEIKEKIEELQLNYEITKGSADGES